VRAEPRMIYGIGTDLCEVARMARLIERHGERGVRRILNEAELQDFAAAQRPASFLARRFAAKEAFSKAIGTGLRAPVTLHSVGVGHDALGKPVFAFAPALQALLRARDLRAHLSIADERDFAIAHVILESVAGAGEHG
jgi:holo-[acyl-carrier protein] synthase